MLACGDLSLLDFWCRQRAMRWYPARAEGCAEAMVLERMASDRPFARMLLLRQDDEFLLRDERSRELAAASDLPALFDAVDGGVADEAMAA